MIHPLEEIEKALDILSVPKWVSREDIRKQYHFLAKKYHPDLGGNSKDMEQINYAYRFLMKYIEEFRYTFDKEEILKQFSGVDYAQRFKS